MLYSLPYITLYLRRDFTGIREYWNSMRHSIEFCPFPFLGHLWIVFSFKQKAYIIDWEIESVFLVGPSRPTLFDTPPPILENWCTFITGRYRRKRRGVSYNQRSLGITCCSAKSWMWGTKCLPLSVWQHGTKVGKVCAAGFDQRRCQIDFKI